jgi:hypothetical protein
MTTRTYQLPALFWYDHLARDLPAGAKIHETKRYVYVELDRETYDELVSDSRHYAYEMGSAGFEGHGLIASARATLRRLLAEPFPTEPDA